MQHVFESPYFFVGFTAAVVFLLALDLFVFHRKAHVVSTREALAWTGFWVGLAMAFNLFIWHALGRAKALEFLTGYLIEEALSVDNIFVFLVIFQYFRVADANRYRVLFWGIVGAIVMRAIFILAGVTLIHKFEWMILVFGGFLVVTGWKLLASKGIEVHPENNPILKFFRRCVPMVPDYRDQRFLVREGGKLFATPLLLVLLVVEATDVLFAVDSIPAILGITRDPMIVYTSNIFAVLGLRSLFFVLAGGVGKFRFLNTGLGLVLVFIGLKMLASHYVHVPIVVSLSVVAALLGGSVILSVLIREKKTEEPDFPGSGDDS